MAIFLKDPSAKLDYGFIWSEYLEAGETIVSSTWALQAGINKESESFSADTTIIELSGGTAGTSYKITNHIVTSAGREDERSHLIKVMER